MDASKQTAKGRGSRSSSHALRRLYERIGFVLSVGGTHRVFDSARAREAERRVRKELR